MKLSNIIDRIKHATFSWISNADSSEEIFNCRLYKKGMTLNENTLYLCKYSALSNHADVLGYSFLCISDTVLNETSYRFHNANCILLQTELTLEKLEHQIELILGNHAVLVSNMARIIQLLQENKGIHSIIEAAYEILMNPILLVDNSFKILASCQDVASVRSDLKTQQELGYVIEENVNAIKQARLYEHARMEHAPYYTKDAGASEGWITALIHIHGIETAHIAVSDSNHPFTDIDIEFVDFLCRIVSLELQKDDFYRSNESLMHSSFLSELLSNHMLDISTIERRANILNWKLTDSLRIITISEQHSNIFAKKAQLISKQLHAILPNNHWVIYEGRIVFLVALQDPSLEALISKSDLKDYLKINHLIGSVSRAFPHLIYCSRFYNESLAAYQLGQRFQPDGILHFYNDYVCQHIGSILAEKYTLSDFYHPAISKIQNYDHIHKTHLLDSLAEYLKHPDNPTAAAKNLFIHKNTYFYRISKIKELFTLDLSNGEERLKLHLSLKFMELEN